MLSINAWIRIFIIAGVWGVIYSPSFAKEYKYIDNNLHTPDLCWRIVNSDGTGIVVPELASKPRPKLRRVRESKSGEKQSFEVRALDVKDFRGANTYVADLPKRVRSEVTYVNMIFEATPSQNPDNGSLLDVDGARIGFKLMTQSANGSMLPRAQLVVEVDNDDGVKEWKPVPLILAIDPEKNLSKSPEICVCLDHKHNTWSLYIKDIRLIEALPLAGNQDTPIIRVSAGAAATDAFRLKSLRLDDKPSARPKKLFAPAKDGRIDFEHVKKTNPDLIIEAGEVRFHKRAEDNGKNHKR